MITLRLYLENIAGDWCGWIEDHPGAFAQGATPQEVERIAARAFSDYLAWFNVHKEALPDHLKGVTTADFTAEIVDTVPEAAEAPWEARHILPEDTRPLRDSDFDRHLRLLRCARADLTAAAHAMPPHEWDTAPPGQQSILALLEHVGRCEIELLGRLGIEPTLRPHPDPWLTLVRTRNAFESAVHEAFARSKDGRAKSDVGGWTLPRVLRITLWNERRATRLIAVRSNPAAYLRSVVRAEAVVRQRDAPERVEENPCAAREAVSLARHTHASGYYY
jgi:hypothetical protein